MPKSRYHINMKSNRYFCYVVRPPSYKRSIFELVIKGNPKCLIQSVRLRILRRLNFWRLRYPGKYSSALMQDMIFTGGIDHITNNLTSLLKEALYVKATPIIFPIRTSPVHNFGKEINRSVDEYYNLSKSYLTTAKGGRERQRLNYILLNDLSQLRGRYRVCVFNPRKPRIPPKSHQNTIIIRYLDRRYNAGLNVGGMPEDHPFKHFYRTTKVNFKLSDQVEKTARKVSAKLGGNYCFFFLMCRFPWDRYGPFDTDLLKKYVNGYLSHPNHKNTLKMIRHFLSAEDLKQRLLEIFPKGSQLYIASNLWKPYNQEHFRPLADAFELYFCDDFSEISALGSPETPDTAKLKLIERTLIKDSADSLVLTYLYPDMNREVFARFNLLNAKE